MFYVYSYNNPSTGLPVYIGKGKGDRFKQHLNNSSNAMLREFITTHSQEDIKNNSEIIFKSEDEKLVLDTEKFLIESYGLVKDGGLLFNTLKSGGSNIIVKLDPETEALLGTMPDMDLADKSGFNWSTLRDRRKELGIKSFKERYKGERELSDRFKKKIVHTIYDTNNRSFTGTQSELSESLGLNTSNLGELFRGRKNHVKGYFLAPSDKVTEYTVFNFTKVGENFTGTYKEFSENYNFLSRSVRNICTGHRKDLKGWVAERCVYE